MALAQTIDPPIEIPAWCPAEFRAIYPHVAATHGEEAAASIARAVKAGHDNTGAWTPDRVATLLQRWFAGRSSGDIAAEIGSGITRNAVIGKLHRLTLTDDLRPTHLARSRPRTSRPPVLRPVVVRTPRPKLVTFPKPAPPPPAPKPVAPTPEPSPTGGVGIFDLRDQHCRWIVSGAGVEARFCGAKRVPDAKRWFCAGHEAKAMDTSGRRRS